MVIMAFRVVVSMVVSVLGHLQTQVRGQGVGDRVQNEIAVPRGVINARDEVVERQAVVEEDVGLAMID